MKKENNIDLEEINIFIKDIERAKKYDRKKISKYHDLIFGINTRVDFNEPCSIMQMRKIKAWYQDKKKR